MICVLTLFGEMDLQNILKKKLQANDIFFIEDNCINFFTSICSARCLYIKINYSTANLEIFLDLQGLSGLACIWLQ